MTTKATWLLDIDGVINALPSHGRIPGTFPASAWVQVEVANSHNEKPWPILAAKPVVDFINWVDDEGLAQILWHSTWYDESNQVGKAIGLNEFGHLECDEYEGWQMGSRGWWKLPAARKVLAQSEGHVVWADDDAMPPHLSQGERRIWRDAGALVIAPNQYQGLAPANLERIKFYLIGDGK